MASQSSPIPVPFSRGKRSPFARVSDWPLINDLLAARSESLMAGHGITTWQARGGQVGSDGRFGFGEFSGAARDVLSEVLDRYPGIRWRDGDGTSWAIRLTGNESDSHFVAHAISCNRGIGLLDSLVRAHMRDRLNRLLAACDIPGRTWSGDDRAHYVQQLQAARQIQLADAAERCMSYLAEAVELTGNNELVVSASEIAIVVWGDADSAWPDDWVAETHASLRAVMGFQFAAIRFGRHGWDPQILAQTTAILCVEQHGADAFRVRIAPLLSTVLNTFMTPSRCNSRGRLNESLQTTGIGVILLGG